MKKCCVFACPNRGARWYLLDPATNVWLCEVCIALAQQEVAREKEKAYQLTK